MSNAMEIRPCPKCGGRMYSEIFKQRKSFPSMMNLFNFNVNEIFFQVKRFRCIKKSCLHVEDHTVNNEGKAIIVDISVPDKRIKGKGLRKK